MTTGGQPVSSFRVNPYLCPSEPNDVVRYEDGVARHYPLNYGVNCGVWLVWDPATKQGGAGAYFPESWLRTRDFKDGLSKTLCLAEVRAYTPYERNAGTVGELAIVESPADLPPGDPKYGPSPADNTGHTEWVDGPRIRRASRPPCAESGCPSRACWSAEYRLDQHAGGQIGPGRNLCGRNGELASGHCECGIDGWRDPRCQ